MNLTEKDPETKSVEDLVEYLMDDDRDGFTHEELCAVAFNERRSHHVVRKDLESYGLKLITRAHEKHIRGVSSSDNDRYWGPGAEKMHGGSGWEQISGFAGQEG